MQIENLKARVRAETGSRAARRMRREGELPVNLSRLSGEAQNLAISGHVFDGIHRSGAQLFKLDLDDVEVEALVREVQYDTFGDRIIHVDFEQIEHGARVEVEVSLEFFGEPAGAEEGGVFQVLKDQIPISCLASAIPDSIEVDVRRLGIGDEIRVRDVILPEGVSLYEVEEDEIVAMVTAHEEEEEAEPEEGAAAEPAVVSRKESGEEDKD